MNMRDAGFEPAMRLVLLPKYFWRKKQKKRDTPPLAG